MSEIKNIGSRCKCPVSLLWISLLLVGFASSIFAAKDYSIETIPNVRLSNRLNHVSNPDGIITPDDAARINQLLNVVEDSLGIEVAVVAVNSIGDQDARMFATDLFKHWGLGQKSKDNGLLIQLVTEPSQRSVVFETGYGIEGVLPDAICYRLQQRYMMPDLKAGNYSAGMLKGVMAVTKYLMSSDYERAGMTGNRTSSSSDDDFYVDIRGGDYRDDRLLGVYSVLKVSSEGMSPLWKENLCIYGAASDSGSDSFLGRSGRRCIPL